jgi:hypothetical protein
VPSGTCISSAGARKCNIQIPNKSLETVQFTLGLLPPDPDDLEEFDEISFVEAWIGTWLVRLLKEGHDESLKAWMNAANKVLKTRAKLSAEPDYIRVQKALESATQNGRRGRMQSSRAGGG